MIIQMLFQISGGRYDGKPWPGPGIPFEVPDWEGEGLVKDKAAMLIAESARKPAPKPVVTELPRQTAPAPPAPSAPASEPVVPEPEPVPAVAELSQPASADPKATWVAYAVSRGASQVEADNLTKSQLQATYGGRL
jgi:hypothetical protein